MQPLKVLLPKVINLSTRSNKKLFKNVSFFSTNSRNCKEHEFTTRLAEERTVKDQFLIKDLCNFGEKTPLEKIKNFNYVLNDEHVNYLTFCLYSELLSRYLFPYISKWVTDGIGFMDKNTKADRDTEFCEFIFKHWKSAPENLPLPPRLHGYDYCSKKYRIRILADKRQIIHSLNYEIDYDMIRQPTTKSPPSLHTLLACVRNFPWNHVIEGDEERNQHKMLTRTFHSSTDYFTFAYVNYLSRNRQNFTIDHDPFGRFWFNQDVLFKCLHHLCELTKGKMEFPFDDGMKEHLKLIRMASLEKSTISNALLLDPESAHSKFLAMFAKFSTKSD